VVVSSDALTEQIERLCQLAGIDKVRFLREALNLLQTKVRQLLTPHRGLVHRR
jgi:hypothetical protein